MTVRLAGIEFDNNVYDADADVLYLHVGDPASARNREDSEEGDGLRYGPEGNLVGITIIDARWRLERDGKIVITMPAHRIEATDLGDMLATA
ncbi:MAG: DUF2283 domain-containing protein [Gaiella sp.]|nr:DUF2283 domain-containing protein [Gaiella sp.]